jgi:hypothetical protein
MNTHRQLLTTFLALCGAAPLCAADRKMVEIEYQGQPRTGTVVRHNDTTGWFLERDGRMEPIALHEVGKFRALGSYRPWGLMELREQLTKEFGNNFSVSSSGHYLVVATRGSGDRFAKLFDELYRQFVVAFTARGFRIQEPEYPLVAVILPDQAGFERYCQKEGVRPQPGLRGYYLPSSNRVALFDTARNGLSTVDSLDETVIHEATHQVAFNLGIHSRMNADPKWVVEGLATVFEREAVRVNDRRTPVAARVNPERYSWFQRLQQGSRRTGVLERLIEADEPFTTSTLDAYSEAWALTFYLLEKRPTEYVNYLRTLSRRDPFVETTPADRRNDFQSAFGRDLELLETQWQRYYRDLGAAEVD